MAIFDSLQLAEARERAALLQVDEYDVSLDLTRDESTFGSRTVVRFTSEGGGTFIDLKARAVSSIQFNGLTLEPELVRRGRLPLLTASGANELVVEAVMDFRNDGEGLHRSLDPADGRSYVYGMSFMDAAPSIFACFDQPDLKAPYTLHVKAPLDWQVMANAAGEQVAPGQWEFERSQPLSTYFVTLIAGPWHVLTGEHDGIPLGLSCRQSLAGSLDTDAQELFTLTGQCFDEFHRLFGIRYPFGKYHQAFVPDFNAGAMENPGCVTFRDPMLFSSKVTRGRRIARAVTLAHEMAHQWFGNLTTPTWWDDLWLNESFAEYMGNRVTAEVTPYDDAWTHNSYVRRQWGLVADQRPSTHPVAGNGAVDALAALQDFDGISYTKGSSILRQLNARLGDEVFFAGVIDHFNNHRFGNATMHDLFAAWERAGAGDLGSFTQDWLRTSGVDTITLDRAADVLRREPPHGSTAQREHAFGVARWTGSEWAQEPVVISAHETPLAVGTEAVVLDPLEDTWALALPDQETVAQLVTLLPRTTDARLRAGVWNALRSAYHNARVAPDAVVDIVVSAMRVEDVDDALAIIVPWSLQEVIPLAGDPVRARARMHQTLLDRVSTAPSGSTLQLAAFQGAVGSCAAPEELRDWLSGGTPHGVEVDLDLHWSLMTRLAALGGIDRDELERQLKADETAKARIEYSRAMSSLPDEEAKEWAWARFTGEVDALNYELEASGHGMWQPGQEALTHPYADLFLAALPRLPQAHRGWMLGTAIRAFAPMTHLDSQWVEKAVALSASEQLEATVRRNLIDVVDDVRRQVAVREAFPDAAAGRQSPRGRSAGSAGAR